MTVPEPSYLCLIPVFWCGWSHHNKNIPSLATSSPIPQNNLAPSNNISCLIHVLGTITGLLSVAPTLTLSAYLRFSMQLFSNITLFGEIMNIFFSCYGVQSETCQYPVLLLFDPFTQQHLLFIFIHDHIPKNPFAMWCTCLILGKSDFST